MVTTQCFSAAAWVSSILPIFFDCLCIGRPSSNVPSLCPSWEDQCIPQRPQRPKALMQPCVTNGAESKDLYRGTCIFTSSLWTRTSTYLVPAFLTKESNVPCPVFLKSSSHQSVELIYFYCRQMCAFLMTYFVHMFKLVLLKNQCGFVTLNKDVLVMSLWTSRGF